MDTEKTMTHKKANSDEIDPREPESFGGRTWFLKDALDTDHIGFTILELDPNENAPEHSHDEQEEIYYVEDGAVDVVVNGESVSLSEGEVIKLDAEDTRQVRNRDRASRLVLVGAPRDAE
jgi:mannose-6-phosphate isomerase-like protein (cupin superfamily)